MEAVRRRPHMYIGTSPAVKSVNNFRPLRSGSVEFQKLAEGKFQITYTGATLREPAWEYFELISCGGSGPEPAIPLALAETAVCSYHCSGVRRTFSRGRLVSEEPIPVVPGGITFHLTFSPES